MAETKKRIYIYDNAKALLILLVVLGHAADYYTASFESLKIFFIFIYLFHMPLFIFIAGLFSKSTINKDPFRIEKVANFIVLYLLMEIIFFLVRRYILGHEHFEFNPFIEDGVPWFMFAMAVWMLLGRFVRKIPKQLVLIVCILWAFAIGYIPLGDHLVAARIIVFFPFFIVGYYMNQFTLAEALKSRELKIASVIFLAFIFFTLYFNIDTLYQIRNVLSGRNPYSSIKLVLDLPASGVWIKIGVTLVTICMGIAVLAIMPHRRTWFTVLGERSLAIYFFHRIILFLYHHYHINNYLKEWFPNRWLLIYLSIFVVVTLLLATKPFDKVLSYVQRGVDYVFKRQPKNV